MKPRLLPLTIFILAIALMDRGFELAGISWVQSSQASDAKKVEAKPEAKTEAKADAKTDEKAEGHGDAKEEKGEIAVPKYSTVKPAENIPVFTTGEKEILEKLSDRRQQLDKWQADLDLREKLIEASSKKLDEKIAELKNIQADTDMLLKSYNEREDAKIKSLVKIYENMKPKEAAAIFNEMDLDISIDIIDNMAEKKASPIIAAMDEKRARKITEEIAIRNSLKEAEGKRNLNISKAEIAPVIAPAAPVPAPAPVAPAQAAQ